MRNKKEIQNIKNQIKELNQRLTTLEGKNLNSPIDNFNEQLVKYLTPGLNNEEETLSEIYHDIFQSNLEASFVEYITGFHVATTLEDAMPTGISPGKEGRSWFWEDFDLNDFGDVADGAYPAGFHNGLNYEAIDLSLFAEYLTERPPNKNLEVRRISNALERKAGVKVKWKDACTLVALFVICLEDDYIEK